MPRDEPNGAGRNGARLTWAVGANGETTHISEAENGLRCACTCPTCGGALVAKQGKVVEHHFAHASGDECQHAVETALHLAAKDILAVRREFVLPAVEFHLPHTSRCIRIAPQRRYLIESVAVERRIGSIIPDVIVRINGRELLVEVTVTHGVDSNKLRKIMELGVSCVEIDLSNAERGVAREELEKIVVDDTAHKRWLYNEYAERVGKKRLSEAAVLPVVRRGWAYNVDGCPIPARIRGQNSFANLIFDCPRCPHALHSSPNYGVLCGGFSALGKPCPPEAVAPRLPQGAFGHLE